MKTPAILLWNRVFDRFEIYSTYGHVSYVHGDFYDAKICLRNYGLREVPINSRIGRQILEKIGERKV